ncbi:MAG: histidine-type phosphatase, partial [Candidatus Cryptobacteroides sp.]
TEEELFNLWQYGNMDQYMRKGPSPLSEGLATDIARPLLEDFVSKAQRQVERQDRCADLRFGHGEGLMPLSALMQIEEASAVISDPGDIFNAWQDYRVTTMAGNIQWIFFRNRKNDILVKILFNEREARIPVETDIWPYYHWNDVLDFYKAVLEGKNPSEGAEEADRRSAKELNSSDFRQLYGVYYINSYEDLPQSKAPAGYKAVHISHYGRHGARYQDKETAYTTVVDKLAAGHANNALTPFGESVYQRLDAFYNKCRGHEGELTRIGWEQHRKIAHQTYGLYPSVFRNNPEITACSSLSHRCVMSMSSFCIGLKEKDPGLDIYAQCSRTLLDEVNPSDKANTNFKDRPLMEWPWVDDYDSFLERRISKEEAESITSRIFKDMDYARNAFSCRKFTVSLYNLISGMGCVSEEDCIDDIFTPDELFDYFETINVGYFKWGAVKKEYARPILNSIIADAQKDLEGSRPTVRLRFGHDTCLQALLHLLDIDGMGTVPASIDDLSKTWHCWKTPMASTLEFVFYRNKAGDVLFKGVLNGNEVKIGVLEAVCGPYYRWTDLQGLYRE